MFVDLKNWLFHFPQSTLSLVYVISFGTVQRERAGLCESVAKYIIFSDVPIQKFIRMSALPVHANES